MKLFPYFRIHFPIPRKYCMHTGIKHIYLILFWVTAVILPAQNRNIISTHVRKHPGTNMENITCKEMPGEKLLPVAGINTIFQDSEGYIWYGTDEGGICRYNGYDMEIFRSDRKNPELMESNAITCIAEDRRKNIWFGTRSGAYILNRKNDSIYMIQDKGVIHEKIKSIATGHDGCMWICAEENIVRYSPEGKFMNLYVSTHYDERTQKDISLLVQNLYRDASGDIWAMQRKGGLLRMDMNKQEKGFVAQKWNMTSFPNFMVEDTLSGCYWIATWNHGVVKYIPDTGEIVSENWNGKPECKMQYLLLDSKHSILWAASTDNLYAYKIEHGNLVNIKPLPFLPSDKYSPGNMMFDKEGCVWITSHSSPSFVLSFDNEKSIRETIWTSQDMAKQHMMVELVICEGDYYWIYQNKTRLSLYERHTGKMVFVTDKAIPSPLTTNRSLEPCRKDKGIWTCYGHRLLKVWHEGTDVFWSEPENISLKSYITTLHDNGKGQLVIGTAKAVYLYNYDKGTVKYLTDTEGAVNDIDMTEDGTIYFTSEKSALKKISLQGTVTKIGSDRNICSVCVDRNRQVWMSTTTGNVYVYQDTTATLREVPLAGNANGDAIKKVDIDSKGHLWILSDRYLKEYNPQSKSFRIIHNRDNNIDMGIFSTMNIVNDSIYVGGPNALCIFTHSASMDDNRNMPHPVVTSLYVNGQRQTIYPSIQPVHLKSDSSVIDIKLSTFDFLHAETIRFAYRLSDKHREWTIMGEGQNTLHIKNLDPGEYQLEVKATNRYGMWGNPKTVLHIIYQTPWHKSWAVRLSMLSLFVFFIVCLYFLKNKKSTGSQTENKRNETGKITDIARLKPTGTSEADRLFIEKATDIVKKNMDNADYSVEQFSKDMCMSRMNLYRKLQSQTGQSPTLFIRDIRLKKAAQLLNSSGYSIAEISDMVGFSSPKYFSRCFKEVYGALPTQYKKT